MANLERVYNVPLRKEWHKAPEYRRAKKAMAALRQFLIKHMKSEDVKIGGHANHEIWKNGIKNPPHHIKVTVIKYEDGTVKAELFGFPVEAEKKEGKKKGKLETLKEKVTGKKANEKEAAEEKPKKSRAKKKAEPAAASQ